MIIQNGDYNGEIGAALDIAGTAEVYIINCTFNNNIAYRGGAIANVGTLLDIKDSTFTSNTALEDFGGAVFSTSDLVVDNCYFENNVAESDGGAIFNSHVPIGHASVFNSKFINNLAKQNSGGAIFNGADLVIGGCYFEKNQAVVSGGAIFSNTRLSFTYEGSIFVENSAPYGGAIYVNIFDTYALNLKFHINHANSGGAVFIDYVINTHTVSNPYFYNCEFSNNYCDYHLLYENYGGAIYFYTSTKSNSQITFNNCSFNSNNAPTYGDAIYAKENIKFEGEATYLRAIMHQIPVVQYIVKVK